MELLQGSPGTFGYNEQTATTWYFDGGGSQYAHASDQYEYPDGFEPVS